MPTRIGTVGIDNIFSDAINDVFYMLDGDDYLRSDFAGVIYAEGGRGNDLLSLGDGGVLGQSGTLLGGSGDDYLVGAVGSDLLEGGSGDDILIGGRPVLFRPLTGEEFEDDNGFASGNDTMSGGTGSDALYGFDGDDVLYGEDGDDSGTVSFFTASAGIKPTVKGGLFGGAGQDYLDGGRGNDWLDGGAGNDTLLGGEGNDTILGGSGVNSFYGGSGNDSLVGGSDRDLMWGDVGNDTLLGFNGNDYMQGGDGDDQLDGGAGGDFLDGGLGFDLARYDGSAAGVVVRLDFGIASGGEAADDTLANIEGVIGSGLQDFLIGSAGANTLFGQNGDDWLFGQGGADQLFGGEGSDQLLGGLGADTMAGGAGNDQFWTLAADFEAGVFDLITDFGEAGNNFDYLRFEGIIAGNVTFTNQGANLLVSTVALGGAGGIIILNFQAAQIADQLTFG